MGFLRLFSPVLCHSCPKSRWYPGNNKGAVDRNTAAGNEWWVLYGDTETGPRLDIKTLWPSMRIFPSHYRTYYTTYLQGPLIHGMMTSSNGNVSALLAIYAGNSPVAAQRHVTRSFDAFFDLLKINGWLNIRKVIWDAIVPLWRHCNGLTLILTWMNNHTPSEIYDEISYTFPKIQQLQFGSLGIDQ